MKLPKIALFPLLIFAGIFVLGFSFFSRILVAQGLKSALGVPVRVGGVYLNLAPLELGVQDVRFSSPEGFREPVMISMPEFFVALDPLAVFQKKIHLRQIRLHIEQVTVERNAAGRINLNEWVRMLQRRQKAGGAAESRPSQPSPAKPGEKEKKAPLLVLVIDEVILNLGKARYVDAASSNTATREFVLNIKDVKLKDAANPLAILEQVAEIVLKKVGLAAVSAGFDKAASDLQKQAGQWVQQAENTVRSWF